MAKEKKRWPAWCLGPGGESVLVQLADELPKGFYHPRLVDKPSDAEPVETKKRGRPPKPLDL